MCIGVCMYICIYVYTGASSRSSLDNAHHVHTYMYIMVLSIRFPGSRISVFLHRFSKLFHRFSQLFHPFSLLFHRLSLISNGISLFFNDFHLISLLFHRLSLFFQRFPSLSIDFHCGRLRPSRRPSGASFLGAFARLYPYNRAARGLPFCRAVIAIIPFVFI